jgi:PLP dependent protein
MNINNNITNVLQNLPTTCKLVVVSKTQPVENILEAYRSGQRIFGENRVQELVPKHEALPKDIQWHMIGHLQGNKVKYIAPFVSLIQSVDTFKLLQEINAQGKKNGRAIPCLLQIFIADEETKYGFSEAEVRTLLESGQLAELGHIRVKGLMGMATFTEDQEKVRQEFRGLRQFFESLGKEALPSNISMEELSMGMSGDYAIAIEEGSTMIRIGTAIFGVRITNNHA